jgi:hypothetical protein
MNTMLPEGLAISENVFKSALVSVWAAVVQRQRSGDESDVRGAESVRCGKEWAACMTKEGGGEAPAAAGLCPRSTRRRAPDEPPSPASWSLRHGKQCAQAGGRSFRCAVGPAALGAGGDK